MGLDVKIFDQESGASGRLISDLPDRFFSTAIGHSQKSTDRFPLLSKVSPEGTTHFGSDDRSALKAEWVQIESLAIGGAERGKWNQVFKVLADDETFVGLEFEARRD